MSKSSSLKLLNEMEILKDEIIQIQRNELNFMENSSISLSISSPEFDSLSERSREKLQSKIESKEKSSNITLQHKITKLKKKLMEYSQKYRNVRKTVETHSTNISDETPIYKEYLDKQLSDISYEIRRIEYPDRQPDEEDLLKMQKRVQELYQEKRQIQAEYEVDKNQRKVDRIKEIRERLDHTGEDIRRMRIISNLTLINGVDEADTIFKENKKKIDTKMIKVTKRLTKARDDKIRTLHRKFNYEDYKQFERAIKLTQKYRTIKKYNLSQETV